ncbi:MAG: class I SAM-dependent methyltransferase [Gallionella sp.]|nr:class I SAM-dependent methyltransferase [Gallionella sp.]
MQTENSIVPICPICGTASSWRQVVALPSALFGRSAKILQCANCKVGRTLPPPEAGREYYEDNARNDELFTQRATIYKKFAEEILTHLDGLRFRKGKLLDFGCGGGFVLEVALQHGYDAEGIELNLEMCSWCVERGLKVTSKNIDQLVSENALYDVIIFSSVLEHLEDPIAMLESCMRILAPDGVVVIAQANFEGLLPRLFPWGWYGWQPKEHFWHFSPVSLRCLCQRCNLQEIELIQGSLHHPWFTRGSPAVLVGRNFAALLARLGGKVGMGDNNYLLAKRIR